MSKKIIVITGIRDPFSRFITAFFEQAHYLNIETKQLNKEDILCLLEKHGNFESTLNWFDNEIKKVFNIDVMTQCREDFDSYKVIEKGKVRIFIYRIDKLNHLEKELASFLHIDEFKIYPHNITDDNPNYKWIKKNFKFNDETINHAENSSFMKTFYNEQEIMSIIKKWKN